MVVGDGGRCVQSQSEAVSNHGFLCGHSVLYEDGAVKCYYQDVMWDLVLGGRGNSGRCLAGKSVSSSEILCRVVPGGQ